MFMAKSMKKMLGQTFSVFELEQCPEMGKLYTVLIEISSYFSRWNWCFFCFFLYILFILSFGSATIVNREMNGVSAILFMSKLMSM